MTTTKNGVLQTVAFDLHEKVLASPLSLVVLPFPSAWRSSLILLEQERTGREGKEVSLPIRPLNNLITALFSQLMTVPGMARAEQNNELPPPWLLALKPIAPESILRVVRGWCWEMFRECPSYKEVLAQLKEGDLQWSDLSLPFESGVESAAPMSEAPPPMPERVPTAQPDRLAYTVLPAYLAELLVQSGATISLRNEARSLVRVPSNQGAEMITWPPTQVLDNNHQPFHYSYVITFSVQTLVGNPRPRIHLHYGVRRWVSRPLVEGDKLYLGTNARSVYLRTTDQWLDLPPGPMFTRAHLRAWYEETPAGGKAKRLPTWDGRIHTIATEKLDIVWPDALELARNPLYYLNPPGKDGVIAAIVEQTPRYHPVQQGMGLDEHRRLTEIIGDALAHVLKLVPPLQRIDRITKSEESSLERNLRDRPREERLEAFVASVGPNATMEVWWQKPEWRNMIIDRIQALLTRNRPKPPPDAEQTAEEVLLADDSLAVLQVALALDAEADVDLFADVELVASAAGDDDDNEEDESDEEDEDTEIVLPVTKQEPAQRKKPRKPLEEEPPADVNTEVMIELPEGGCIRIVPKPLGAMGEVFTALATPRPKRWDRAEHQRLQTQARITLIRNTLHPVSEPTLAFVELPNYQDPQKPQLRREFGLRDPKRAIRLGMAHTGRLTKFSESADPLRARATGAVLEGLRQLGYLTAPISFKLPQRRNFPEKLLVAGIWVCRLTQKRGFMKVHLPVVTLFHTQTYRVSLWLPDGKGVRPFSQGLLDITLIDPKVVQRANQAVALKQLRQFLNNDIHQLGADDIVLLSEAQNIRLTLTGLQNPSIAKDSLRLGKGKEEPVIDLRKGRIRVIRLRRSSRQETPEWYTQDAEAGRGYVQGIWPEPTAFRTYYNIARKPHTLKNERHRGKESHPGEYYALPSILEILQVALHKDDTPDLWAYAIDQWRRMGYLTNDMTLMPLPLQWAEHVDRYAEVISPWVFPEQWGEEAPDEGEPGDSEGVLQLSLFE